MVPFFALLLRLSHTGRATDKKHKNVKCSDAKCQNGSKVQLSHTQKICKSFDRTLKILGEFHLPSEELKLFHYWLWTCFRMFVGQFEAVLHMFVSNLRRQRSSNLTGGSTDWLPYAVFVIPVLIICILFIKQHLIHAERHRKRHVCSTQPSELFTEQKFRKIIKS